MLGEKLIAAGVITQAQLDEALAKQKSSGNRLGDVLVEMGYATHDQIEAAFAG